MSGNKMLKGAAIIGIAGVIVKIMGAFFRIPLTNWLGAGGIAYYSFAYTIYAALVVLATAGFPVAISRLVSKAFAAFGAALRGAEPSPVPAKGDPKDGDVHGDPTASAPCF